MLNRTLHASFLSLPVMAALAGCAGAPEVQDGSGGAPQSFSSVVSHTGAPAPGEPTLAELRTVTERFRNVKVALAEGYIPDPSGMCVTAEMEGRPAHEGTMGIHYFRPDLLGITGPPNPRVNGTSTYTDFEKPAILIYEPQADGSLELVAVENLVFIKAWEQAGNKQPPSFHGVPFDRMEDDPATPVDEAHGFEPHYDRHVWIYRENPNGIFAQYNPNATCKHHKQQGQHKH